LNVIYFILASYERAREIIGADLYHVRLVVQVLRGDRSVWPVTYSTAQKADMCRVLLVEDARLASTFLVSLSIVEQVLLDGGDVLLHCEDGFFFAPSVAAAYAWALSGVTPQVLLFAGFDRFCIFSFPLLSAAIVSVQSGQHMRS
jgi:hypothetical protein